VVQEVRAFKVAFQKVAEVVAQKVFQFVVKVRFQPYPPGGLTWTVLPETQYFERLQGYALDAAP